jgi:soluble lytic murein transglycosylase
VVVVGVIVALALATHQSMPAWYARYWYPLEYDTAINRDARRNGLDPALVAAVIWRESDYDATARSSRGAVGLMQVLPSTAYFIASRPDPPPGNPRDLTDPEVSISFGSWYLRYLIDMHDGSVAQALAAYNGGPGNLRNWKARALTRGAEFRLPDDIPFPETRKYVTDVIGAWPIYRDAYGDRLGDAAP